MFLKRVTGSKWIQGSEKNKIFLKMVLLVKMANLQKHLFFKISCYMIERCMKDEQEEKKKEK